MAVDRISIEYSKRDASHGAAVRGLYTPAMLADLLAVPVAAIRRWHRKGALQAVQSVQRLPYFDFAEAAIARRLAQLYRAGCSLRTIDRKLLELSRLLPGVDRPLNDPAVVIEGRRLFWRRGDDLAEPGGQLLLEFEPAPRGAEHDEAPHVIPFAGSTHRTSASTASASCSAQASTEELVQRLQQEAQDWEDEGRFDQAAEAYRTILMAVGARADVSFALADVLYRAGDLSAARERYFATLELDVGFVEARASLGCVLAEMGELELAAATFHGALDDHADFADVHFHLANVLERLDRSGDAAAHFEAFLELAPESAWAAAARERLAALSEIGV
jgi:tetratricopeptide (TPR) repeat protein